MSPERFEHLLSMIGPKIRKKFCPSREPITPAERLIVTLRYLATSESLQTQSFYFRIGRTTVCNIISETTRAIWDSLMPIYLKSPDTIEEWRTIAFEFEKEWNYTNCVGAICNAKYCFTMVDIGSYGRDNNASIFNESEIYNAFQNNLLNLPKHKTTSSKSKLEMTFSV
ncbi:uncharacterized protein LOC130629382 [Hydractinia symbiolongicarpus]|uniref:uncharacterized protein LOC130629382 n=1 Tax=Hydractinia symbiolongicarpus TaxID=13093 RepID=UPI002550F7D1|nr:uncharacterized protein LOC130629382 [Hydractinia symbiolongicarpus]